MEPSVKRMFVSVSDKKDLVLLRGLTNMGWEIVSTGGTETELTELGIPVTAVEKYTGMPAVMDGRLKTLHPKVFGGILANRNKGEHLDVVRRYGMHLFDIVVVNLYDFATDPSIEKIDVGGPALLRAAGKNLESVTVIVDPEDYTSVIMEILKTCATSLQTRRCLATKAFLHCSEYDKMISEWLASQDTP